MSLDTNLNVAPYYDDYDEDKNFHQVLFRPAVPVQARELTQLQTILQNQIERFGDNIFKIGTVIKGCSFSFDHSVKYIKLLDNQVDGQEVNVSMYANSFAVDTNGLKADILTQQSGLQAQTPDLNTLFIKYLNVGSGGQKTFSPGSTITIYGKTYPLTSINVVSGGTLYSNNDAVVITANGTGSGATASIVTYSNGTIRSILLTNAGSDYLLPPVVTVTSNTGTGAVLTAINYIGQAVIANNSFTAPTGNSFTASVSEGIIYQKGFFIRVDPQLIVVSKYNNQPNNAVLGFDTTESIVNSSIDTTLLDNAAGYSNFQAPGANRLKLTPVLKVLSKSDTVANTQFFSLVEFENGQVVRDRTDTQFNSINTELSRRTYEESGNYVVKTFPIGTEAITSNTTHLNVVVGAGIGYIEGHRIEQFNNSRIAIPKATVEKTDLSQTVSTAYGNYVFVNELLGNFNIKEGSRVSLRNTAATDITDNAGGTPTSPGSEIGSAMIRSIVFDSGTPGTPEAVYRVYLFNIVMSPGFSFKSVRSIRSETNGVGVADVVLVGGEAVLNDVRFDSLVFPSGTFAVKNFNNEEYTYRTQSNTSFATDGTFQINLTGSGEEWPYTPSSTLNNIQERDFIIVPTANIVSSVNKTGTVTTSGANTVTGSGTLFTTEYLVGQYIKVGAQNPARITNITNNTFLSVATTIASTTANVHTVSYPAHVPVNSVPASISIDGTGKILTYSLGHNITATANVSVYHDVDVENAAPKTKTLNEGIYVKISTANIGANTNGTWSLGHPDVLRLTGVWVGTGNTYATTGTNQVNEFILDNGQRDNYYGLATIKRRPGSKVALTSNSCLLVKLDVFTHSTGKYISTESYPVDDASTVLPTGKIRTQSIPVFVSSTHGSAISLRDAIDFRPLVANTAAVANTVGGATVDPASTLSFGTSNKFYPSPDGEFTGDIISFLSRKDLVVLDTYGRIRVVQGKPSNSPIAPATPKGTMPLGTLNVPPFPSLSAKEADDAKRPDYAVLVAPTQQKGFTMEDIQDISDRLARLEYYTSLNTLEQNTKNLTLPSEANTSFERFKNGFFVDPFNDYSISNLEDPEFNAMIDTNESVLRPIQNQTNISLKYSANNSSSITVKGDYALLNYTEVEALNQPVATKQRTLVDKYWSWKGRASAFPAYDNYFDVTTKPVNVTIDTSSALTSLASAINQNLARSTAVVNQTVNRSSPALVGTRSENDGFFNTTTQTFAQDISTTVTSSVQQLVGGTPVTTTQQVGDFLTDISIRPYIRAQQVKVFVNGLRPGAQHYVFFDKQHVSSACAPATVPGSVSEVTESHFTITGARGTALVANSRGELAFVFDLPANTFFVGEREILVMDFNDLSSVESATSTATTRFVAYNFGAEASSVSLSTKSVTPYVQSTLTTSATTTTRVSFERESREWVWSGWGDTGGGGNGGGDPLSQTFTLKTGKGNDGYYVTSIDVYFAQKDTSLGVTLELREVNAGVPTARPLPETRVWMPSALVNTSSTAATATRFTFKTPVYVKADTEYAIVIYPDGLSPNYRVWTSRVGEPDVLNSAISNNKNWGNGTLFYSTSGTSWTPVQDEDLKFKLQVASFTASSGTVGFVNDDYEFLNVTIRSGAFKGGESIAQIGNTYSNGTITTVTTNNIVTGTGTNFSSLTVGDSVALLYGSSPVQSNGFVTVTGTSVANSFGTTSFSAEYAAGDFIRFTDGANGEIRQVVTVTSNTAMTIDAPLTVAASNVRTYRISASYDVAKITAITNATSMALDRYGMANGIASYAKVVSGVVEMYDSLNDLLIVNKSNAANSTFRVNAANSTYLGTLVCDVSQARAVVTAVSNVSINYFSPLISRLEVPGTTTSLSVGVTNLSTNTIVTDTYKFGEKSRVPFEGVIKSKSNEINGISLTKSLVVTVPVTSTYTQISPAVDVNPVSMLFAENLINDAPVGETGVYGNAEAKYVSKRIVLADSLDAEDAIVYLTAYKPVGTEIDVYVKALNPADDESFLSKDWTLLEQETAPVFSTSLNETDRREYKYVVPKTPPNTALNGFASGNTTTTTLSGVNTAWNTDLVANDMIKVIRTNSETDYAVRRVVSVGGATTLTMDSELPFTASGLTVAKITQKNALFKYNQNSNIVRYYSVDLAAHDTYKYLAIKIVLRSPFNYLVPVVDDVRVLCVSV